MKEVELFKKEWERTGSPSDHAKYLLASVEAGQLSSERLAAAATLGHPGALLTLVTPATLPSDFAERIEEALRLVSVQSALTFAVECGYRALDAWEQKFEDTIPRSAVETAAHSLSSEIGRDVLLALSDAAADVADRIDYPEMQRDSDPATFRSYMAAHAAAHIALAAADATLTLDSPEYQEIRQTVSDAVALATKSSIDAKDEEQWQSIRLAELLLQNP